MPIERCTQVKRPLHGGECRRLDRIYVSENVKIVESLVAPNPFSDHDIISASLNIPLPDPRGKGYWKNNSSIYDREDFQEELEIRWAKWKTLVGTIYPDYFSWWLHAKERVKNLVIKWARIKKPRMMLK